MLIRSMSVSVDGSITGRDGDFDWSAPSEELCARRLYETMPPVTEDVPLD